MPNNINLIIKLIYSTAYHEAGHAVVAHLTPGAEPIHKATVMPRGRALGISIQLRNLIRFYPNDSLCQEW